MRALELKIPPLILLAAFAALMALLAHSAPHGAIAIPGHRLLALLLLALGVLMPALGALALRQHGTTVNPMQPEASRRIVQSGIYRYSRNPMYLGFVLMLSAWGLWLSHPLALALAPTFALWLQRFQIKPEERILLRKFGSPYADYLSKVRRWC